MDAGLEELLNSVHKAVLRGYWDGLKDKDCPYTEGTFCETAWRQGFQLAKDVVGELEYLMGCYTH